MQTRIIDKKKLTTKLRFVKVLGMIGIIGCMYNAYAIPYLDNNSIKRAAISIDKEKQAEAYKANPKAKNVDKFCEMLAQARVGKDYKISITDRRVPNLGEITGNYTVVGNAQHKTKEDDKLSYVCKVVIDDNGKQTLQEFKLYEVQAESLGQ